MKRLLESYWPMILTVLCVPILVWTVLFYDWRVMVATGIILFFVFSILGFIWINKMHKRQMTQMAALPRNLEFEKVLNWTNDVSTKLSDVAGCDEVRWEVQRLINFLKDSKRYTRLGGRMPSGVLLIGHPGTGKTLLGKAMAGEAGVPFGYVKGADFVKTFVGSGPARIKAAFGELRKRKPCIFFIDEIDGIGKRDDSPMNREYNNTVTALLAEMDGPESNNENEGLLIVGSTNKPMSLDPALLRGGRFGKRLIVDLPDIKGREEILKVHVKKIIVDPNADLKKIAKLTHDLPGSELANIVNEAAIMAAERGADAVEQNDLVEAVDSTMYGPEKRSRKLIEETRRRVAYHECGHTIAIIYKPGNDKVRKLTIISRALAKGLNHCMPETEGLPETDDFLKARMVGMMGGRAAEELIFRNSSSGPKADLSNATDIAKKMTCEYGMTPAGLRTFGLSHNFLNIPTSESLPCSPKKHDEVDRWIDKLLNDAYEEALRIVKEHRIELEALTMAILEKETLTGEEIEEILKPFKSST